MKPDLFLGVDVGTGSARAGVFDSSGVLLGRGECQIRIWRDQPGHVEQSSDDIWQGVCRSVIDAVASAGINADRIAGMGFDATCSLVAVDVNGASVSVSTSGEDERNVVVWMDHRAIEDAAAINALEHPALRYVGGSISPEMQTPKLRWIKRELPQSWHRAAHWFDLPDFLSWRATGRTDRSMCSLTCKWTFQGHLAEWDDSYLAKIGLGDMVADNHARIGQTVRVAGECVGGLTAAAAADLQLPVGVPVSSSLIDAHAGMLGALNAVDSEIPAERRLVVIAGTSACHLKLSSSQLEVPGVWGPYFGVVLPDQWLLEAGISASGAFLDHVLNSHPASRESGFGGLDQLEACVRERLQRGESIPSLIDDLHLQPNVAGNRSPLADPGLSGGVAGWRNRDDGADLERWYLAALHALACSTRHIVEAFEDRGAPIDVLIGCGGSALNEQWSQMHADVLGIPVAIPTQSEAVLLGAAMLGAAASGVMTLGEGMSAMSGVSQLVQPSLVDTDFHDRKYRVYRKMIDDLREYEDIMLRSL
jgi:FGGY-family pentulose kinase